MKKILLIYMLNTNGDGDASIKYSNGDIIFTTNNRQQIVVDKNSNVAIKNNLVISKNAGIKIDTDAPTHGWRDIIGDVVPDTQGAGSATLAAWRGGSYRCFFYAVNDRCDIVYHIPHDYAIGTDLFLHLHWGHNGTAISGQLVVTFGISYAKGHNQANFDVEVAPILTVATPNITTIPQYRHLLNEIQISVNGGEVDKINTALVEPDGLVLVGLTTTTIPTITGGSVNSPAFFTLDIHYQSTNIATKQKAPNFYV